MAGRVDTVKEQERRSQRVIGVRPGTSTTYWLGDRLNSISALFRDQVQVDHETPYIQSTSADDDADDLLVTLLTQIFTSNPGTEELELDLDVVSHILREKLRRRKRHLSMRCRVELGSIIPRQISPRSSVKDDDSEITRRSTTPLPLRRRSFPRYTKCRRRTVSRVSRLRTAGKPVRWI